jgi:hypothetical protein
MTEDQGEGYRGLAEVFERVLADDDFPDAQVNRLEIRVLAGGEATYNVWAVGSDEPVGGYIGPD